MTARASRLLHTLRLTLMLAGATTGLLAHAQPPPLPGEGFDWERVGNHPLNNGCLAFDGGGDLWACTGTWIWRLDRSKGFPGTWVVVNDFQPNRQLLHLGPDTVLTTVGTFTFRSTDGGLSFTEVIREGDEGLYEIPQGLPHAGRVLVGGKGGIQFHDDIAYSDDRGATWNPTAVLEWGGADAFVAFPPGAAHAGRVLTAGRWGVSFSDDGGASLQESSLWGFQYQGHAVNVAERPGGGHRAVAIGYDQTKPDLRVWTSDDGGETWTDQGGLPEDGSGRGLFTLGGSTVLAVGGRGTVYRSDDAGQTWAAVGRAPDISDRIYAKTAVLGPDDRLYVGLQELGANGAWVYRTEPLTAAASVEISAQPVAPPVVISLGGGAFRFAVTLTNTTGETQTVDAWSEADGPLALAPVLGPRTVTLAPGASVTRTFTQRVPANAPAGTYTYTVAVGAFPDTIRASDGFTVVKQGAAGAAAGAATAGWAVSGWEPVATGASEAGVGLEARLNPSGGPAEVVLTLAQPGAASVALYDALGRRVALLHEGVLAAGSHRLTLDGTTLAPGVYVVRAEVGGAIVTRRLTRLR